MAKDKLTAVDFGYRTARVIDQEAPVLMGIKQSRMMVIWLSALGELLSKAASDPRIGEGMERYLNEAYPQAKDKTLLQFAVRDLVQKHEGEKLTRALAMLVGKTEFGPMFDEGHTAVIKLLGQVKLT